jgi:hypothetical protein
MSYPTPFTGHAKQAAGRLINAFGTKPTIAAFNKALAAEVTTLENGIWSVINAVLNPYGPILDSLGEIVNLKRQGLPDAQYLAAQRVQARVLRADGRPDILLGITAAFQSYDYPGTDGTIRLDEWAPRTLDITVVGIVSPALLAGFLHRARQSGHRLLFIYDLPGTTYATNAHRPFVGDSVYGGATGAAVGGSVYGSVNSAGYGVACLAT